MVKFIIALYIVEQKQKNLKAKQAHTFKGFPCSYNAKILKFSFELQLKDTESAIKNKTNISFRVSKKWKMMIKENTTHLHALEERSSY